MRAMAVSLVLILITAAAMAQEPGTSANQVITFTSSEQVAALMAKAKSERKEDQPTITQRLLQLPPYHASLEASFRRTLMRSTES